MREDKPNEILNELKSLPKPVLQHQVQELILNEIQQFESTYNRKKWWRMMMKRTVASFITAAAILVLSLIGVELFQDKSNLDESSTNSQQVSRNSKDPESKVLSEQGEYYDSILEDHQVALDDLYVWISERKDMVDIDREVKDGFVVVTIRDKDTKELLITYGESLGEGNLKTVYQEIERDNVMIKLEAVVEIDEETNKISQVIDTNLQLDPPAINNENGYVYAYGYTENSGHSYDNNATAYPPATKVEIQASLAGEWEYGLDDEVLVIGVIPK